MNAGDEDSEPPMNLYIVLIRTVNSIDAPGVFVSLHAKNLCYSSLPFIVVVVVELFNRIEDETNTYARKAERLVSPCDL